MEKDKAKYVEMEREIHPWASDEILMQIVEDELKNNPDCYEDEDDEEEVGDPMLTIIIGGKGEAADPFPEEEDEDETEDKE